MPNFEDDELFNDYDDEEFDDYEDEDLGDDEESEDYYDLEELQEKLSEQLPTGLKTIKDFFKAILDAIKKTRDEDYSCNIVSFNKLDSCMEFLKTYNETIANAKKLASEHIEFNDIKSTIKKCELELEYRKGNFINNLVDEINWNLENQRYNVAYAIAKIFTFPFIEDKNGLYKKSKEKYISFALSKAKELIEKEKYDDAIEFLVSISEETDVNSLLHICYQGLDKVQSEDDVTKEDSPKTSDKVEAKKRKKTKNENEVDVIKFNKEELLPNEIRNVIFNFYQVGLIKDFKVEKLPIEYTTIKMVYFLGEIDADFSCMIGYEQEESVTKYRTETRKEEYLKVEDEYIGTEKVSKLVNATRYVDDYVPYTDTKTYYSWTQYENSIHDDNSAISLVDDYIIVDPQIYSKDKIKKDFKENIVSLFRSGTIKEKASISNEQKQGIAEIAIEDLIDQSLPGDTYEKLNYRYSIDNTEVKYVELDCANISIGGFIISLIKVKGNVYCLLPKETYSSFKKFFIYKAAYPLILQLYYNDYSDYSDFLDLDDVPDTALNDYSFAAKSIMLKYVEKAKNLQQLNQLFKCNEMPLLTNKESNDILKHDGNDSLDEYIRKMNIYIQGYTLLSRKLHSAAKQEFRKILGFKNATKEYNKISDHLKKMTVYVVLATIIMLAIVIPIFIAIMKNMLGL